MLSLKAAVLPNAGAAGAQLQHRRATPGLAGTGCGLTLQSAALSCSPSRAGFAGSLAAGRGGLLRVSAGGGGGSSDLESEGLEQQSFSSLAKAVANKLASEVAGQEGTYNRLKLWCEQGAWGRSVGGQEGSTVRPRISTASWRCCMQAGVCLENSPRGCDSMCRLDQAAGPAKRAVEEGAKGKSDQGSRGHAVVLHLQGCAYLLCTDVRACEEFQPATSLQTFLAPAPRQHGRSQGGGQAGQGRAGQGRQPGGQRAGRVELHEGGREPELGRMLASNRLRSTAQGDGSTAQADGRLGAWLQRL